MTSVICKSCGAELNPDSKFCTSCGAKAEVAPEPAHEEAAAALLVENKSAKSAPVSHQTPAPVYTPQPLAPPVIPAADPRPPKGSKYAPIGTFGYIGYMILMGIPVIGLIFTIVWSFGGGPVNRRSLARAVLVFMIIGIALSIYALLTYWPLLSQYIKIDFGI